MVSGIVNVYEPDALVAVMDSLRVDGAPVPPFALKISVAVYVLSLAKLAVNVISDVTLL